MRHLAYTAEIAGAYPICILAPHLNREEMRKAYLDPYGVDPADVLALTLHHAPGKKKTPVKEIKEYIETELVPVMKDFEVQYALVNDSEYFKALTGATKVDVNLGYVLDSAFGPWKVVYVPSYRAIFYDPDKIVPKIAQGMTALQQHRAGTYTPPGNEVLKFSDFPKTDAEIAAWLNKLLDMDVPLAIDIESFSLKPHTAGIGTIGFAWNKHEGIAFPVDYVEVFNYSPEGIRIAPYGIQKKNEFRRGLLRSFFFQLQKTALYHKIAFDVTILIYQLFMDDITDTKGLLQGLDVMLQDFDCSLLITYLATNSCSGNKLSLKEQSQEFAGNYSMGEDIKDITKIPLEKLLPYNLIDCCSTWFTKEKHWPTLIADQQLDTYRFYQKATKDIVQMQLTGLPVNMRKVKAAKFILDRAATKALRKIHASPIVTEFNQRRLENYVTTKNEEWKKKRTTAEETRELAKTNENVRKEITFNPNSNPQLQDMLYTMLGLPVIALTDSRQPATDGATLKDLQNHTDEPEIKAFLKALLDYVGVAKIISDFIPSLLAAIPGKDGWHYLCGNFNLGGTQSGRLSSSDPNLQNLPANSKWAKLIKWCIEAPPGWIFCGLDFSSLEDRISGLTTKDPNKLKVYTDGYDGHAMRAVAYFGDEMPDIDPMSVASVNSIAVKGHKYAHFRQDSKVPTFLLTYGGTYIGLMKQAGFPKDKAQLIEARYHEFYQVSDKWVQDRLDEAALCGYVTLAFGLRLRTPILQQVIRHTSRTPHEAEAEGRSAGNALGQTWCQLNTRAWIATMEIVRSSEYREDIRPCAQIHDAGYALVRDNMDALAFLNDNLVREVQWQEDPLIWHDEVKLGGELSVFWPTWRDEIVIPNAANANDLPEIINKALQERKAA